MLNGTTREYRRERKVELLSKQVSSNRLLAFHCACVSSMRCFMSHRHFVLASSSSTWLLLSFPSLLACLPAFFWCAHYQFSSFILCLPFKFMWRASSPSSSTAAKSWPPLVYLQWLLLKGFFKVVWWLLFDRCREREIGTR